MLANFAVLFIGVYLTMQGQFTAGMVMAFQGFLVPFMTPAQTLIAPGQALQEMRTLMERIDDVMEYPEETVFSENASSEDSAKGSQNAWPNRRILQPFKRGKTAGVFDSNMGEKR